MDILQIGHNIHNTFHMLRHFETVPGETIEALINCGYTNEDIEDELKLPGSRFFSSFADTIPALLNKVAESIYSIKQGLNDNLIINGNIPGNAPSEMIGTTSVTNLNNLSTKQKKSLFYKENRGVNLKHLIVDELPGTNEFSLIVKKELNNYFFITAFPGNSGLPIPDTSMNSALFKECSAFWEQQVFLITAEK